jgi:hypothetical protein
MQQFSAYSVFSAGVLIESVRLESYIASTALSSDGKPGFAMMLPIDDKLRDKAMRTLESLASDCKTLALNTSAEMVAGMRSTLERDAHRDNVQWLLDQMKTVRDLMSTEMKWRVYAYIPAEKAKYFTTGKARLFGEEVDKAFPDARNDVHEAGCCMALTRPTAAVFHLMRVLECGLAALGKVFSIPLAHTNWGSAIEQIESKIRDMHKDAIWKVKPDCKDMQVKYAQAAATFGVLKDAWRNHTMHSRVAYEEEEAEHIFGNVKMFMRKLAALGLTS